MTEHEKDGMTLDVLEPKPMKPATLRRLMRTELDAAALQATVNNDRVSLKTLRLVVERGILDDLINDDEDAR
jgi:hypothetical protein